MLRLKPAPTHWLSASAFPVRTKSANRQARNWFYWLDLAITEMRPVAWWSGLPDIGVPGPALPWFLLSWYGASAGHGWLQVEGMVRREGSIKPLLAFVHRARYAAWVHLPWPSFRKADPKASIEALCAETALAILKELRGALSHPD